MFLLFSFTMHWFLYSGSEDSNWSRKGGRGLSLYLPFYQKRKSFPDATLQVSRKSLWPELSHVLSRLQRTLRKQVSGRDLGRGSAHYLDWCGPSRIYSLELATWAPTNIGVVFARRRRRSYWVTQGQQGLPLSYWTNYLLQVSVLIFRLGRL